MAIQVFRDALSGRELVGTLDGDGVGRMSFTYDSAFLTRGYDARSYGLSVQMPLDDYPYAADECESFFRGLLPEGEVLGNLAERFQVPRNDYVSMLRRLGCESIGSLTFLSDGVDLTNYQPRYGKLNRERLSLFQSNPTRAVTLEASETRLSLSGAQAKVAWTLLPERDPSQADVDDWMVPLDTAASTHIVKVCRTDEREIATNEKVCMEIARRCGFPVPHVASIPFLPGAIAVERYDRAWREGDQGQWVLRLHQEDFCQALGWAGALKYQPRGLPTSYPALVGEMLRDASDNKGDCREFAKRTMFNYLIGNADNHLKNHSLLYNDTWTQRSMGPLYDVTCIPLTGYSTQMAFMIGAHRAIEEIDAKDFDKLAGDLELDVSECKADCLGLLDSFNAVDCSSFNEDERLMAERIMENSASRGRVLQAFAS